MTIKGCSLHFIQLLSSVSTGIGNNSLKRAYKCESTKSEIDKATQLKNLSSNTWNLKSEYGNFFKAILILRRGYLLYGVKM